MWAGGKDDFTVALFAENCIEPCEHGIALATFVRYHLEISNKLQIRHLPRGTKNTWSVLHLAVEHEQQLKASREDSRETECKGSEPWKFTCAINAPEGTQLNPLRTFIVINSHFAVVVAHIM